MVADGAAGVPAGGELAAESVAFSVLELGAAEADCLAGLSSLTKSGSTIARNLSSGTLSVTMREDFGDAAPAGVPGPALFDFRRSLAAAAFLLDGAITAVKTVPMR